MGSVHLDPSLVRLLCVRPLSGLCKFETLVGFVHFVDWGLDPWWGPSTLWIGVLTLGGVRPLCGLV